MATSEDLVLAVLDRLNEAGAAQSVDNDDAQKIRDTIPRVLADLLYRNVIFQQIDSEAIADSQFLHLRSVVAKVISGDFGAAGDGPLAAEAAQAINDLRTLARINRGTRCTLRVDPGIRQGNVRRIHVRIG